MQELDFPYVADGIEMNGKLFVPGGALRAGPGMLVFPEAFGLGAHAIDRARRLAELGHVALACDLHGGRKVFDDFAELMRLITPLRADAIKIRARASPALAALAARPDVDPARIAAIGFCFGGTMALELARSGAPVAAVVGFHSGLGTGRPQDAVHISARILVCVGADDPSIPASQRAEFEAEMRAANVRADIMVYGGVVHSFTNPAADQIGRPEFARFDAEADRHSWMLMQDVLDQALH